MKYMRRFLCYLLIVSMIFGLLTPMTVEAKGRPQISKKSVQLYVGQSKKISVKGVSGKVKWTSSKRSVATVSQNGKIKAKKAGKATIKAKVKGKTYRCRVTVKNPKLSRKTLTISVGKSAKITLHGSKIRKVKSSNSKVALINKNGIVTGKGKGTAKLTITGTNKKNYTCRVTVVETKTPVYKVRFETDSKDTIPEKVYKKGSALGELPTPNKLNYVFAGWYYDKEWKKPVSERDTVTKSLTLYARYDQIQELAYEENAYSCVKRDVSESFTIPIISDESMSLEEAQSYISIENITSPNASDSMVLSGKEKDFRLSFTEGGYDPGASYKVILSNDNLHFVDAPKAVREYDFTAYAEEVINMKYADDVRYLKASDFSDITINGKPADRFSITLFSVGEDGQAEGRLEGTFSSKEKFKVGDTVILYDGVRPDKRTTDTPTEQCGDVAYVKITEVNGDHYAFEQAESEDVIFTPDMLPVHADIDKDKTDGNVLTADKDELVFTDDIYANMGLDSQTTIDVGDFLVFYEGELDPENASEILYGEITDITESGEDYVIQYNIVDWDYVSGIMDVHTSENMDISEGIDQKTIAKIEKNVEKQAIESGFAQEAGSYLAELAMETDTFSEISDDMVLNDYKVTMEDGTIVDTKNIRTMAAKGKVDVSRPEVDATISKHLKQYDNVKGLRLVLKISTTITIHGSDAADVRIRLSGAFEQEISLDVGLKAKAEWDVWGIFPYISEYRVNASVDLYEYTGIEIQADITTVEGGSGNNFNGQNLAQQIKDLLDTFESSREEGERESISNKLVQKYKDLLENESDWVELYKIEIFSREQYITQALPIVAVAMEANFVIQVNANVSIGLDFYYKNAKRYNYSIGVFARSIENNVINLCEERYEFDFYVMGALGIRAGVELQLAIGLFSTKLDSVGFSCEAGAYVRLWGYFWYKLLYTQSAGRKQSYLGALYVQVGAYLEIAFEAQAFNGRFSKSLNLFEKEWPLWDVGGRENVLDFKIEKEDMPEIKLKQYIKEAVLPDDIFEMNYLDLVEGEEASKIYNEEVSAGYFTIRMTNDKFQYDAKTNILRVVPDSKDVKLEGDMIITWIPAPLAFTSKPIQRTIHITWDNLRDGYVIIPFTKGGSYVPIIVAQYEEAIKRPKDPTRLGYVFDGWYEDEDYSEAYTFPETMSYYDTSIYAKWTEAEDTPYKIRYYLQKLESDEYTLEKTVEGTGRTNSVLKPEPEDYEGYLTPQTKELKILADGSAVLNYYYDRLVNQVTFSSGEVDGDNKVVRLKYGAKVTAPVFTANGYEFKGWDKEVKETMGAENVTYTALWKPVETTYRIEYYVQNVDGRYRLCDTVKGEALPHTTFTSDQLRKDDLYENEADSITFSSVTVNGVDIDRTPEKKAEVASNGKTVIKVNYARAYGDITFRCNNEENDIVEKYYKGQKVEFPQVSRSGYIFCGWYKDAALSVKAGNDELASPGDVYYAKWETNPVIVVNHYIMKPDGTYGTGADRSLSFETETGKEVDASDYVAKDILVPDGINVDRFSAEKITAEPGENIINIYYKRMKYSLHWNLSGGEAEPGYTYTPSGDYYYGAPIIAPRPVRHGYMYSWVDIPATTMPAKDVSYQVTWEENDKPVIRFVKDNETLAEISGYEGDSISLPEALQERAQKTGYRFSGWDQEIPTTYPAYNMTITALYEVISYGIQYEKNGGEFPKGTVAKESYTIEDENVSLPAPEKKGYIFEGWCSDSECNTDTINMIPKGSTGERTIYAKWTAVTYSIVFDGSNADKNSVTMEPLTIKYDQKVKLPESRYTKAGYQFAGWTLVQGGQKVQFSDEAEVENLTDQDKATITLYAIFDQYYHLSYQNLGDGHMAEDAITEFAPDSSSITLEAPEKNKTGYTFDGWYLSSNYASNTKVETITPGTMQRNIKVYAKWKANQYSITYDNNLKGGSSGVTQLCTYDTVTSLKAFNQLPFSRPGYAFMGWTKDPDSERIDYWDNQEVKNLVTGGNVHLYAVWRKITYVINFIYGGGSNNSDNVSTYAIDSDDMILEAPSQINPGYEFLGWYDDETDSYVSRINKGSYGNRILVAKWAHGGIFDIEYDRTTESGTSYYRIIRHIPEHVVVTSDVQNVYYRTENGTAIGGTAQEVNFLHVGGTEKFVTFHQTDGDGSSKEITVRNENSTVAFTPNGSAQYPASSMVAQVDGKIPEKYYFVKVTDVLSTQERCQGYVDSTKSKVKRVIPRDDSRVVDLAQIGKEYSVSLPDHMEDKKIVGSSDSRLYSYDINGILNTFAPSMRLVDREYVEDTTQYYDYYITADVREAYDGYQKIKFYTEKEGAIKGYLKYQFEIHPRSCDKNWQNNKKFPAPPGTNQNYIDQDEVKKFKLDESNLDGISEEIMNGIRKVRISRSVSRFHVDCGAKGSGSDDWHIRNIKEYLTPTDTKPAKQVSIAPMAFGKYKAGDAITISVVLDELIQTYTPESGSETTLTNRLNALGIPVSTASIHDVSATNGTNVIYIDAVLENDFEVTTALNQSLVINQSLLGGTATDLSGNTGSLQ